MARSNISFQWNESRSVLIKRKGFGKDLNYEIAKIFERHMYKYVPYDSRRTEGTHLADSSYITANENVGRVTYRKPYANRQYYGLEFNHDTTVHQLATSIWDHFCWENEKSVIGREANAARKRYAK